jgi:hypothetical protein
LLCWRIPVTLLYIIKLVFLCLVPMSGSVMSLLDLRQSLFHSWLQKWKQNLVSVVDEPWLLSQI